MKITLRIVSVILAFMLICTALFVAPISVSALSNRHGYINGTSVNIRSGAGTSNSSLGKLDINTPVLVQSAHFDGNGARWYKLTAYTSSGDIDGYVHSDYVTITGSDNACKAVVVSAETPVNVREKAGTDSTSITKLNNGTEVLAIGSEYSSNGKLWYHIKFALNGETVTGYMHSAYVQLIPEYSEDKSFEEHLEEQGFPESYKVKLRELHTLYPNWIFLAKKSELTWDEALAGQTKGGTSTVHGSAYESWKSLQEKDYDWEDNTWEVYDSGGWVAAADNVVAYYLDPRNFLTATGIFQFISMKYYPEINTKSNLQSALNGTFMEGAFPEDTYDTYADILIAAAKESGVSPISLAAMIIVEQGSNGHGGSISGTVSGYEGYYNYFNIRAYQSGGYNAVQYGLLYAMGEDATNYRPWNTRTKSILGGAKYYGSQYLNRGQDNLYLKKFNVVSKPYFSHQYMTNVQGAASEAASTAKGYADIMNSGLIFNIPVYEDMPEQNCPYPTTTGNNDCYLSDISLNGYSYSPTFNRYVNNYEIIVEGAVKEIVVTPVASANDSTVVGGGKIALKEGYNDIDITVTSSSGLKNTYTVTVFREEYEEEIPDPVINGKVYTFDGTYIKGIKGSTTKAVLETNLDIEGGSVRIKDATEYIKTGDIVEILDLDSQVRYTYTAVVEGDINCDGKFSLVDIAFFQRCLLGMSTVSNDAAIKSADLNGDGRLSLVDIARMQRMLLGI
ncbi:MAG: SH3 domain-containing protein [Acutalibacteraceae bacterium]|nr:SH3 domain-containing protein [Acutalibacteraceae bacterium]